MEIKKNIYELKEIRFSHDPTQPQYEDSALDWEWKYLQEKYGYTEVKLKEGYWYGVK